MMKKIFIVEDSVSVSESLFDLLDSSGYSPKVANNGEEALEMLNKNYFPDLIISDIMMPGIDGYQLKNIIASNPDWAQIPFIFLTARAQNDDIRKGMNSGADDYLTKPYKATDLLKAVEIRLNKKEALDKKIDIISKNFSLYVPHELRTPLVSILGYSGLLLSEKDDISTEEIFYMIDRINNSAHRLHDTIEKFILYSELSRTLDDDNYLKILDQPPSIGLDKIIRGTAFDIAKKYDRVKDLKYNLIDGNLEIPLLLFSTIIKQIVDNSFKFSKQGELVTISSSQNDDVYSISFRDEGMGMENEDIKIIDAFVQLNRNEHQQIGNGLGLFIAKRILQKFNGKLEIKSKKEEFTEITVSFPASV